jgi:hypothetical protein
MSAFLFFDSLIVIKSIVQAEIKIKLFRSFRFMQQHQHSFEPLGDAIWFS